MSSNKKKRFSSFSKRLQGEKNRNQKKKTKQIRSCSQMQEQALFYLQPPSCNSEANFLRVYFQDMENNNQYLNFFQVETSSQQLSGQGRKAVRNKFKFWRTF